MLFLQVFYFFFLLFFFYFSSKQAMVRKASGTVNYGDREEETWEAAGSPLHGH